MAEEPDANATPGLPPTENTATGGLEDDTEALPDLADLRAHANYISLNFNAPTTIGRFGGVTTGKPATKGINDREVVDAHRHFVAPPDFAELAHKLYAQRILVLSGQAQTGRRCAALALLTRSAPLLEVIGEGPVIEVAPGTTPKALLEMPFERGGRYLLDGCEPDDADPDRAGFDLTRLWDRVYDAGAVLVATTSASPLTSHSLTVPFRPVDCVTVLDAYLEGRDRYDDQTRSRLRDLAAQRRLWEMKAFIDQLEEGGPDAVAWHFHENVRNKLRKQLEENPKVQDLLPLVVAALLPGVGEPHFEAHLHRLHRLVDDYARRGPWTGKYDGSLRPSRANRPEWLVTLSDPYDNRKRIVRLVDELPLEALLAELWRSYGRELWGPVHDWLIELPAPRQDVGDQIALATGVAALARVDPVVTNGIIEAWARHDAPAQRMAAAATLSALTQHEATASDALRRAIAWSRGQGRLRIVAAMAFGQALSRVFPAEAVSHLWYLCFGSHVIASSARRQFAAMLWPAARDGAQIRRVLSIVAWQLEQQLQHQAYPNKRLGQAIEAVWTILSAPLADGSNVTLHVLRHLPEHVAYLGRLWAEVLRSWPHRGVGLDLLRSTHAALGPAGADRFAAFGDVVQQHLSPPEWRWLCRDLAIPAWTATSTEHSSVGDEVSA